MRSRIQISGFVHHILLALSLLPAFAYGQNILDLLPERKNEWQRVSTDTYGVIDVNTSSLVLETNGRIRATFRTTLSKQEQLVEKPGTKYKIRLDTFQFDSREGTYRLIETDLLDSRGNVVYASGMNTTGAWKPLHGRSAGQFYQTAIALPPLGAWTVVAARYPDGTVPRSKDDDPSGPTLLRSRVMTELHNFEVPGEKRCTTPSYESASLKNDEFAKWTGFSLKDAGFVTDKVDAIKIRCASSDLTSEIHVLLFTAANRATLLSGGVLLDLERH